MIARRFWRLKSQTWTICYFTIKSVKKGVQKMRSEATAVLTGHRDHDEEKRHGCQHHWVIDMAEGPVSKGRWETCGIQREFHNFLSDCLAANDKETYEQWLARQGQQERRRARAKRGGIFAAGE